jgi:hypothetical protein
MRYSTDLEDLTDDPFLQQRQRQERLQQTGIDDTLEPLTAAPQSQIPAITRGPGPQIPDITGAPIDPQARYQKMLQDGPNMQGTNPSVLRRILGGLAGMANPELGGKITNWKGLGVMNRYNQDLGQAKAGAAADIANRGVGIRQQGADTRDRQVANQGDNYREKLDQGNRNLDLRESYQRDLQKQHNDKMEQAKLALASGDTYKAGQLKHEADQLALGWSQLSALKSERDTSHKEFESGLALRSSDMDKSDETQANRLDKMAAAQATALALLKPGPEQKAALAAVENTRAMALEARQKQVE